MSTSAKRVRDILFLKLFLITFFPLDAELVSWFAKVSNLLYTELSYWSWGSIVFLLLKCPSFKGPTFATISNTDLYLSYFDLSYVFPGHNDSVKRGLTVPKEFMNSDATSKRLLPQYDTSASKSGSID